MAHEIEPSHEKNHIGQQEPVFLECNLAFPHKCTGDITSRFTNLLSVTIDLCFWQTQAEQDDEDWRASTEPIQLMTISDWD